MSPRPFVPFRVRNWLFAIVLLQCLSLFPVKAYSQNSREDSESLVLFFKESFNSPPDIEYFLAKHQSVKKAPMVAGHAKALEKALAEQGKNINEPSPPVFFEGARSGTNFFFTRLSGASENELKPSMVSGRFGSNFYQVWVNELRMTSEANRADEENPALAMSRSDYKLINQMFCMEVGMLTDRSVVWNQNTFTAKRDGYPQIFGELSISNNLPATLKIRKVKGGTPIYIVNYDYPDPPNSLGGFPSRMTTLKKFTEGWLPSTEVSLLTCRIAPQPLPEDLFSASKFITTNITFTNIYSNGITYAVLSNGTLRANQQREKVQHGLTPSTRRVVFLSVFTLFTTVIVWRVFKTNSRKKD